MILSDEQELIRDWAVCNYGTRRSLIVNALAGSGKTTTAAAVVEKIAELHPTKPAVYMAFGKRNVKDMTRKALELTLPPGHEYRISTQHSLGLSTMKGQQLNFNRTREIIAKLDIAKSNWGYGLSELVSQAQNAGVMVPDENGNVFMPDVDQWEDLACRFDIDSMFPVNRVTRETWRMVKVWMEKILEAHAKLGGGVTFGDQIWLPLVNPGLRKTIPKFPLIVIDEFQDTSVLRRIFANECAGPESLRLWIGDENQSIMGFAGADSAAFNSVKASQLCTVDTLKITVSRRLTQASAKWSGELVPDMKSWEGAEPGEPPIASKFDRINPRPGEAVLTRTNRMVIDVMFRFMTKGIAARIEGDEFAKKMNKLHENFRKRAEISHMNLTEYRAFLHNTGAAKIKECLDEGRKWKAVKISDEYSSLIRIVDFALRSPVEVLTSTVGTHQGPFGKPPDWTIRDLRTVSEVVGYLLSNSGDDEGSRNKMITISTGHKAKGLQWQTVYWYAFDTMHPSKYAITPEEKRQDKNLEYVMRTRSLGLNYLVPQVVEIPEFEEAERNSDDDD